jgi:hypothetical protein
MRVRLRVRVKGTVTVRVEAAVGAVAERCDAQSGVRYIYGQGHIYIWLGVP